MYGVISILIFSGAWFWLYRETFTQLLELWQHTEYLYCWLVPLVVAVMAVQRRSRFRTPRLFSPSLGYVFLFLALGALFWGQRHNFQALVFLSMWLSLSAGFFLFNGTRAFKIYFFPLVILSFAFPKPYLVDLLIRTMQKVGAATTMQFMPFLGIPSSMEGKGIVLGGFFFDIANAFSAMRFGVAVILVGVLSAYWLHRVFLSRAVLVVSAVPLVILANSLALSLFAALRWGVSTEAAEYYLINLYLPAILMFFTAFFVGMNIFLKVLAGNAGWPVIKSSNRTKLSRRLDVTIDPRPIYHLVFGALLLVAVYFVQAEI